MREDIKSLVEKIEGDDDTARQNAITNLMFLMEESTKAIVKNNMIDDEHMSENEQVEVIRALLMLAESLRPEYSGLLWVVGKARRSLMLELVQDFILKYVNTMPDEMLYQALVALENCMVRTSSKDYKVIKSKLKHEQLLAELRKVKTQDSRLESILHDTISIVEFFISQTD